SAYAFVNVTHAAGARRARAVASVDWRSAAGAGCTWSIPNQPTADRSRRAWAAQSAHSSRWACTAAASVSLHPSSAHAPNMSEMSACATIAASHSRPYRDRQRRRTVYLPAAMRGHRCGPPGPEDFRLRRTGSVSANSTVRRSGAASVNRGASMAYFKIWRASLGLVELGGGARGLEPRPPACKIGPGCRKRSLTWAAAPSASARIGPCRILLWSGLVVSVDRGAQIGGEAGVEPLGGAGRSGPPASRAEVSAGPYASLGG